jgi:hypothetical protein
MNQSSVPNVFNMIERTYIRKTPTITVRVQKTPLIAKIEGAFVDMSVAVDTSASNLKTEGLSIVGC